jgi:hypothetical protein
MRKKRTRIFYVSILVPPFAAMTIPPFGIFILKKHKGNNRILRHDLIHWRQYKRMGAVMYYLRYILQLLIIGYDTMPMEMEARQGEKEYVKWNYRQLHHAKHSHQKTNNTMGKRNQQTNLPTPYVGLPVQYTGNETLMAAVITAVINVETVNLTLFPDGGGIEHVNTTMEWQLIPIEFPE